MQKFQKNLSTLALSALLTAGLAAVAVTHAQSGASAASPFVGTWQVMVKDPHAGTFPVIISLHADGTLNEIQTEVEDGSKDVGLGSWQASGAHGIVLSFWEHSKDPSAKRLGLTTISGKASMNAAGTTFTGTSGGMVTTLDGQKVAQWGGQTLMGTRLTVPKGL